MTPRMAVLCGAVLVASGWAVWSLARPSEPGYAQRFELSFPARAVARPLVSYVSVKSYDERFLGIPPGPLSTDGGDLAWKTSYRMAGLNEMFRATRDPKYLQTNLLWAGKVMSARDEATGQKLSTGEVGVGWSSGRYGPRTRTPYVVHTAMITYPILEMMILSDPPLSKDEAGLLEGVLRSLDAHDVQWRDGPAADEGHYIYTREQEPDLAGQPLPINRDCAMAKSLWLAWRLTRQPEYRRKALALGRLFKNRLQVSDDGAYTWSYNVVLGQAEESQPPEDTSHGALTASLAVLLHADGEVFNDHDMERFAATVEHGVTTPLSGVIAGDIGGSDDADPSGSELPARWLELSPFSRTIYPRIAAYYERYDADRSPDTASLATALLLRYRPARGGGKTRG